MKIKKLIEDIKIKTGKVDISNLDSNIIDYISTLEPEFQEMFLATSGNDSKHSKNSRHFKNKAVDFRFNNKLYKRIKQDPNRLKYGITLLDPSHGTAPHLHMSVGNATENKKDVWLDPHSNEARKIINGAQTSTESLRETPWRDMKRSSRQPMYFSSSANNATYAGIGEQEEVKKEATNNGISESKLREILSQERKRNEDQFLNAFNQQRAQNQGSPEQQYQQESLDHLYQIEDIEQYAAGGEQGCGGEGQPPCDEEEKKISEYREFIESYDTLEDRANEFLGFPDNLPEANSVGEHRDLYSSIDTSSEGREDAARHMATSAATAQGIQNRTGNIPGLSHVAGYLGSNYLGLAHEIGSIDFENGVGDFLDSVADTPSDLINNLIGSVIGSLPISDKEKGDKINYLLKNKLTPEGRGTMERYRANEEAALSDEDIKEYEEAKKYSDGGEQNCGGVGQPPCDEDFYKTVRDSRKGPYPHIEGQEDGTTSSHLMKREYVPRKGWVAFASLYQDGDKWVDLGKKHGDNWEAMYEDALKRDEVYSFGEDEQKAIDFADKGSWKFDPEGDGYDYFTAEKHGIEPDSTGHYPSRSSKTGQILKGKNHKTYNKTVKGEADAGYEIYKGKGDRYYSRKIKKLSEGGKYTIKSGDSLSKIAKQNNISIEELLNLNESYKENPNAVNIGDEITLSVSKNTPTTVDVRNKELRELPKDIIPTNYVDKRKTFLDTSSIDFNNIDYGSIFNTENKETDSNTRNPIEALSKLENNPDVSKEGVENVLKYLRENDGKDIDLDYTKLGIAPSETNPGGLFISQEEQGRVNEENIRANMTPEERNLERESQYENLSKKQVIDLQKELVDSGDLEVKHKVPKGVDATKKLQKLLISKGYDLGEFGESADGVDGKFGERTRKALNKYNRGLSTIDGDLGDATKAALQGRSSKEDVNERFFDFKNEKDIVGYQTNLENQGYFQGIDFEPANDEDLTVRSKVTPKEEGILGTVKGMLYGNEEEGLLNTVKGLFSGDEEEGRPAPSCSFDPIPGSSSNDSRCTAFVGDEIEKAVGEEGRKQAGAYGDAWTVSNNIIGAGGREIFSVYEDKKPNLTSGEIEPYIKERVKGGLGNLTKQMFVEGDVINLFYEGSTFKKQAYDQAGDKYFTTHTGVVKRNSAGDLFVEHNVGGSVSKVPIQDLIDNKVKHDGNKDISVTSIIRPNYSKEYYDSSEAQVNEENVGEFGDLGSKNAAMFTQTLIKNKSKLLKDIPINESEFSKLTKAAKAIGWKETGFDVIKLENNPRDWSLKDDVYDRLGEARELLGGKEKSRGITRMKDEKNLSPKLREKYITDGGRNLNNPQESAIPTFYALSSRYLYLRDLTKSKGLDYSNDELTQLAMLGWNEKINVIGESMQKYKTFDKTMNAYNTNKETGEKEAHPYSLAFEAYNNYLK